MNLHSELERLAPHPSQILDDIQDLDFADYEQAIQLYVKKITSHPGVRFVGKFGSVHTPGISDIDMLVVTSDEEHKSISEKSTRIIRELPNGPYLFWHPATVVPESLTNICRVLNSFRRLELQWGDGTILDQFQRPAFSVSAIRTIVWNSYFWGLVIALRAREQRARKLLLLLGNIIQSTAADYEILGNEIKAQKIMDIGMDLRQDIVKQPKFERAELLTGSIADALQDWEAADWDLQQWWRETSSVGSLGDSSFLEIRPATVHFKHDPNGSESGISYEAVARLWRRLRGGSTLTLPLFYLQVSLALGNAFDSQAVPWSTNQPTRLNTQSALDSNRIPGIRQYAQAIMEVLQFSYTTGDQDKRLFETLSVSPFGF